MSHLQKYDIKNKSFIVTGASGFVGHHLVRELIEKGAHSVYAVDCIESAWQLPRVKYIKCRIEDSNLKVLFSSSVNKIDCIFHLAAIKHHQEMHDVKDLYASNVLGTANLIDLAIFLGNVKIIFTSSLYAYGRMSGSNFIESETPGPKTFYGETKLTAERMLDLACKLYGLPFVILRYMFVYGPEQDNKHGYPSMIKKNLLRILEEKPVVINGDGKQILDYVYIEDVIEATLLALSNDADGEIFNVGAASSISVEEICGLISELAGTNKNREFAEADFTHQTRRVANIDKIFSKLGWQPAYSLQQGILKTFESLKKI